MTLKYNSVLRFLNCDNDDNSINDYIDDDNNNNDDNSNNYNTTYACVCVCGIPETD